jgi:hypothetical protein
LLFAREFRSTPSPSAALAANVLGAVVGGLMENLSLVLGLKALLLIAALFYLVAGIGLRDAATSESTILNSTGEREPDTVADSV